MPLVLEDAFAGAAGAGAEEEAVTVVEGRPTRRRSVARGTSSYGSQVPCPEENRDSVYDSYIELGLELLQTAKCFRDRLIREERLVLPQRPLTDLRVLRFRDGIFQECLLKLIKGDDDAEELGKRVLKVALGSGVRELHLLQLTTSAACHLAGLFVEGRVPRPS